MTQFNDLTRACGRTYEVQVQKGPTRNRLGGEGWRQFIARNHLIGDSELVCFSLGGVIPKITVIYLKSG